MLRAVGCLEARTRLHNSARNKVLFDVMCSFICMWGVVFFLDHRIACLPVDRDGVDPAKPAIPPETHL